MEMQPANEKTFLKGRSRGDSIFVSPSMGAIEINSADKVQQPDADSPEARADRAINASIVVNVLLTLAKTYAALDSGSLAILSSLIDSVLDLFSIAIVKYTDKQAKAKFNHEFPAGQRRLEPLGVMACAALMCMAALEVIRQALQTLFGSTPQEVVDDITLTVIAAAVVIASIIMKALLYQYCMVQAGDNASVEALAQDHRNDVITNTCALLAVVIVEIGGIGYWWVDSTGAALLSVWIVWGWISQALEQGEMLVGKGAGDEFIGQVENCADSFQAEVKDKGIEIQIDQIKAYHFGPRFIVEVIMVMNKSTTLLVAHDQGLELQHRIERLEEVERAFVKLDYEKHGADYDDHIVES